MSRLRFLVGRKKLRITAHLQRCSENMEVLAASMKKTADSCGAFTKAKGESK